jgi:hypothetical protein
MEHKDLRPGRLGHSHHFKFTDRRRALINLPISESHESRPPLSGESETTMGDYGVDLLQEALGLSEPSGPGPSNSRLFEKKDVPSVAKYIQSDACRKIYLMVISS